MLIHIKANFADLAWFDRSFTNQGLEFSFDRNLERIIKISLLCLLVVKDVGINPILMNDNSKLVKIIQRPKQLGLTAV